MSDTIVVSSLHVQGCMISFYDISWLLVISLRNHDNDHNVIMIMVIPIKNFILDTIEVSSLHVMVYMISFNKISLLVVTSFNDYDNIHNVIMIMVTPIGNSHIRYNRGVIFAWDAMYNTFQSCVSTCIPNIISYLINAPHSRAPATDMSVSGARESAAHTSHRRCA